MDLTSDVRSPPLGAAPNLIKLVGVVLIVAMTLAAYWPALHAGFIWDDDQYVTGNGLLQTWDGLQRIWLPRQTPQYYPVVFTSFWIEHKLWGFNPSGYHAVNIALHVLNAMFIWRLCTVLRIGPPMAAWLIAAVFALHPVHVESVAWITERKNVLSGFFYLASALAFLRFDDAEKGEAASVRLGWKWYIASLVLFVMAMLSKSVTCSLPAALILIMLWQRKPLHIRRLLPLAPMFIVGVALGIHTAWLERDHVLAVGPDFAFSLADRFLISSKALLFYPTKLLWPHPLIFVYERWSIESDDLAGYWSVVVVALIVVGAIISYFKGLRGPALALAFFAGTIFPALGFVNIYPMIFSFVADHFQYLASVGIIVLVIGSLAFLVKRFSFAIVAVAAVALPLLAATTWHQARAYRTIETLWEDTLAKNDRAWLAHSNLVPILVARSETSRQAGDKLTAVTLRSRAVEHGRRAIEIKPNDAPTRSNYSQALLCDNRLTDATAQIKAAIELWPDHADYRWQLGYLQELQSETYEAIVGYRKALEINPQSILYRASLARLLIRRGEASHAAAELKTLLEAAQSQPLGVNELTTLDSLATTCAESRNFVHAIQIVTLLELQAQQTNRTAMLESLRKRLERYRAAESP